MAKKKQGRKAPLKGNVAPTTKTKTAIQPVYGVVYTSGKAPSSRPPKHR